MHNRKSVGPRMEPCGTPASTDIFGKTSHTERLEVIYY